jgi:hypothetical protein
MTAAARKRADLVLSGGGIKGVALVGAVGALIDATVSPMTYAWKLRVKLRSTGVAHSLAPRPASPLPKKLAPPRSAIRSLPQDEFQPAIRVFD